MANLSKSRRERLLAYIDKLKETHTDDESIILFNELQNALTEKRYGLVFEEHSETVDEMLMDSIPVLTADPERRLCTDSNLPWNFIIQGDNLQALYLLEKTHKGKIDCIYIDPPYNTGAKDWKYNNDYVGREDDYRHSKWLSMIKSRLAIAKKLLNPTDSVLIVTIDEKEYLHLGCLLEEMFPEASMQMISSIINPSGVAREGDFYRTDEYIYILRFGSCKPAKLPLSEEWITAKSSGKDSVRWRPIRRQGADDTRAAAPNQFYPIYLSTDGKKIVGTGETLPISMSREDYSVPDNVVVVWPLKPDGTEGRWQISQDSIMKLTNEGYTKVSFTKKWGYVPQYLAEGERSKVSAGVFPILGKDENGTLILGEAEGAGAPFIPGTQWRISSHSAREQGAMLLNRIFPDQRFSFPKSLYAVHDVLRFFVTNKPEAIVLDFFAGSGTTFHAVNLLNAEDGGNRRCIMVTNNEVSADEAKFLREAGYNPGDDEWERLGIAKYVTWPRTVCSIRGVDTSGRILKGDYLPSIPNGESIPMSTGFKSNVKFLKCDWISKEDTEYLSEELMQHITEMIELEHAIEVDNDKIVVILSEEEADQLEINWSQYKNIKHIYLSSNVLLTSKQNTLFNNVSIHYIPDYYFDVEMKEVGETW